MTKVKGKGAVNAPPPATTKKEVILNLLRADDGTTLDAIVAVTSWQPHTARAVLTGLRRKGYLIERTSGEGGTRYRLAAEPRL
jgi:DNA-binding IclR family transcriptional regulator